MVITFADQLAITPAGRPVERPIPVAPDVVCVIFVKTVFTHKAGVELAMLTAFPEVTARVVLAVV